VTLTEPSAPADGRRKAAMSFIMVTVLIDMMSIGLVVPVLPHIVGTFTRSNDEQTMAFLAVMLAFAVANFLTSPVLGSLSDRFGRRPVLLLGLAGMATSFFVTAAAASLWMLLAVRVLSGAMQGNVSIANAYVADISSAEDRARRFGQLGAMFGIGFILGPVIGGLLGDIDLRLPFVAAGVLAVLNGVFGYFVLPESLPTENRRAFDWRRANPVSSLRGLAALKGVGPLVLVLALSGLAQSMLYMTWVLYTKFKFGWAPGDVGWSLLAVGVMSALGQGVLLKPLLKRFSPRRLAVMGMTSTALAYLGWGLASQAWMLYAVIFLNVLGGVASASLQSIISNAADATRQGQTMGAVSSLNSLMAVIGPIVGLELLRWVSDLPPGHLLIGLPLFTCAALQFAALLIALHVFRQHASHAPATA
jgi:DHA1 family tetracycline resistance protein-like MFS transporter